MGYHSPEEILRLARNFMESRILLSGAELNLFTILSRSPLSAQEVSDGIGADLRAITILLDALAAMGLLTNTVKPTAVHLPFPRFFQTIHLVQFYPWFSIWLISGNDGHG